jgi:cytoplasmic iron level regulating protein YaaA (DUF328/UPF0246 family)
MITILSPAKRLNYTDPELTDNYTIPSFIEESEIIMKKLKKLNASGVKKLMNINDSLAEVNYERFQNWKPEFNLKIARQAITTFKGDVYLGIDVKSYTNEDFITAQKHIRILSGLHGILKPLDLIRPYRLEMGTNLKIGRSKNLYDFWGNKILESIESEPAYKEDGIIVNLASQEYYNAIPAIRLKGRVITPTFKESPIDQFIFSSKKPEGI